MEVAAAAFALAGAVLRMAQLFRRQFNDLDQNGETEHLQNELVGLSHVLDQVATSTARNGMLYGPEARQNHLNELHGYLQGILQEVQQFMKEIAGFEEIARNRKNIVQVCRRVLARKQKYWLENVSRSSERLKTFMSVSLGRTYCPPNTTSTRDSLAPKNAVDAHDQGQVPYYKGPASSYGAVQSDQWSYLWVKYGYLMRPPSHTVQTDHPRVSQHVCCGNGNPISVARDASALNRQPSLGINGTHKSANGPGFNAIFLSFGQNSQPLLAAGHSDEHSHKALSAEAMYQSLASPRFDTRARPKTDRRVIYINGLSVSGIAAFLSVASAFCMHNYDLNHQRENQTPEQNIPPELTVLMNPSPPTFVAATFIHGISTLLYHHSRPTDRFQECFLAAGGSSGIIVGLMEGMDVQSVLVGVLPMITIASLLLCSATNLLSSFFTGCAKRKRGKTSDLESQGEK